MPKTLYFLKDDELSGQTGFSAKFFGIRPDGKGTYDEYYALRRQISLKTDLAWREVQNLQRIFRGSEIWQNFPVEGLKFVFAELQAGDEDQRIDLLYLRDDGGLYPCELKLGGTSLDTHGQLIRYLADLHYQAINTDWLVAKRLAYLTNKGTTDEREHKTEERELREFLSDRNITDRHLHVIRNSGIIVDEDFKPQMLKAVRYLNEFCGFSIRLLRLAAYVAEDWSVAQTRYLMRLDVEELQ